MELRLLFWTSFDSAHCGQCIMREKAPNPQCISVDTTVASSVLLVALHVAKGTWDRNWVTNGNAVFPLSMPRIHLHTCNILYLCLLRITVSFQPITRCTCCASWGALLIFLPAHLVDTIANNQFRLLSNNDTHTHTKHSVFIFLGDDPRTSTLTSLHSPCRNMDVRYLSLSCLPPCCYVCFSAGLFSEWPPQLHSGREHCRCEMTQWSLLGCRCLERHFWTNPVFRVPLFMGWSWCLDCIWGFWVDNL